MIIRAALATIDKLPIPWLFFFFPLTICAYRSPKAASFGCARCYDLSGFLTFFLPVVFHWPIQPPMMPKSIDFDESRISEACQVVLSKKMPKIAKVAREFGVDRKTLTRRVGKAKSPITPTKSLRNALEPHQEKALISWIVQMHGWNLPPTPAVVGAWANRALARSGQPDRQVGKNWAYGFIKRLPKNQALGPVKQKTKELKRIQAEDAGLLQHWYAQLETVLHDVPARLIYNFDECGFQPGQGRSRNVIGANSSCPDLAETERGENITALECIAADGWQMDPLFIFKGTGQNLMEAWFYGSENLSPDRMTAISPNGWISDELALAWLGYFIQLTAHRVNRGEKRVLIFDGHGAHLTLEFLRTCEDMGNRISWRLLGQFARRPFRSGLYAILLESVGFILLMVVKLWQVLLIS